jgi:hypothetical protein
MTMKGGLKRRDAFRAAGLAALASGVMAGDTFRRPLQADVVADRTRYASPVGNDAADGRSWAKAKGTLQAAYDSLGPNDYPHGSLVLVDIGDYDVGPDLALHRDKPASSAAWPGRNSSRPPTRTWHPAASGRRAALRQWSPPTLQTA